MRARLTVVLLVCCLLISAAPSGTTDHRLAAPDLLIFHGAELGRRIYLPNHVDNHRLLVLGGTSPTKAPAGLEHRRSFLVAMFYRLTWRAYARDTTDLSKVDVARANMHARFYPAADGAEALLVFTTSRVERPVLRVEPEGLRMLERRGVPTTIER